MPSLTVYPRVTDSYLHGQQVQSKYRKHASAGRRLLSVFIILAIVFGLLQSARALISGCYKLSVLMNNQKIVDQYHHQAIQDNQLLKNQIAIYSSPAGIEELARNNLQMVGQDEILVRIH